MPASVVSTPYETGDEPLVRNRRNSMRRKRDERASR